METEKRSKYAAKVAARKAPGEPSEYERMVVEMDDYMQKMAAVADWASTVCADVETMQGGIEALKPQPRFLRNSFLGAVGDMLAKVARVARKIEDHANVAKGVTP